MLRFLFPLFIYSKQSCLSSEVIIIPLDTWGWVAGELLLPGSQHTESKGFQRSTLVIFVFVQSQLRLHMSLWVPGIVCVSLVKVLKENVAQTPMERY